MGSDLQYRRLMKLCTSWKRQTRVIGSDGWIISGLVSFATVNGSGLKFFLAASGAPLEAVATQSSTELSIGGNSGNGDPVSKAKVEVSKKLKFRIFCRYLALSTVKWQVHFSPLILKITIMMNCSKNMTFLKTF